MDRQSARALFLSMEKKKKKEKKRARALSLDGPTTDPQNVGKGWGGGGYYLFFD